MSSAWTTAKMLRSPRLAGGVRVRFPVFKFPIGEARETSVCCDPVLRVSLGGACFGDVDADSWA